jgi:hypothetical protein
LHGQKQIGLVQHLVVLQVMQQGVGHYAHTGRQKHSRTIRPYRWVRKDSFQKARQVDGILAKLIGEQHATVFRVFDFKASIGFTVLLGAVMTASAGLNAWLGDVGLLAGAAVSGFADAHATAASAASLMAAGKIQIN